MRFHDEDFTGHNLAPEFTHVSIGNRANVAMSPYDLNKARITYRQA